MQIDNKDSYIRRWFRERLVFHGKTEAEANELAAAHDVEAASAFDQRLAEAEAEVGEADLGRPSDRPLAEALTAVDAYAQSLLQT